MHLPSVGLGTMGIDDPEPVATALSLGYRHLDTARIYGNEAVVGDGLAEGLAASDVDRDEVTVATKLWVDDLGAADVGPTARESADLLGVETLDLLYVHRPRGAYDPVETPPRARPARRRGGRARGRRLQLRGRPARPRDRHPRRAARGPPDGATPLFYRPELLEHAREHGYTVVAYSPLAGGRVSEIDAVVEVAEAHDATPEAVAIAWATAKEPVVTIPKASSEGHLRANLAAAEIELTPEEVAAIDAVEREEELFPE